MINAKIKLFNFARKTAPRYRAMKVNGIRRNNKRIIFIDAQGS